jgi:hypothetical protein
VALAHCCLLSLFVVEEGLVLFDVTLAGGGQRVAQMRNSPDSASPFHCTHELSADDVAWGTELMRSASYRDNGVTTKMQAEYERRVAEGTDEEDDVGTLTWADVEVEDQDVNNDDEDDEDDDEDEDDTEYEDGDEASEWRCWYLREGLDYKFFNLANLATVRAALFRQRSCFHWAKLFAEGHHRRRVWNVFGVDVGSGVIVDDRL